MQIICNKVKEKSPVRTALIHNDNFYTIILNFTSFLDHVLIDLVATTFFIHFLKCQNI